MKLEDLLIKTVEEEASDLHITVGTAPRIRKSGTLLELGNENIVTIIQDVIDNGTEADQQLDKFQKSGMEGLLVFLMEDVDYN